MSTNFSPNIVFARTVAVAVSGIFVPWRSSIVTSACPSTSFTDETLPTLTPRILTSLSFWSP